MITVMFLSLYIHLNTNNHCPE